MKILKTSGIAERLEIVKREYRLNNTELGELGGTSFQTIRQMVANKVAKPNLTILVNISNKLKIRSEWLIYGEGLMTNEMKPESPKIEEPENKYLKDILESMEKRFQEQSKTIMEQVKTIQEQSHTINILVQQKFVNFHKVADVPHIMVAQKKASRKILKGVFKKINPEVQLMQG